MCSCAAELATEAAHKITQPLLICRLVWGDVVCKRSDMRHTAQVLLSADWLATVITTLPTSHTNKLRLTDGRLSSLLSLLQPINAGTQELHLPITWKLFQHSIGVGQKIILDTWKKYFSDCYKKHWHFSWISWRSQRNITKVWWWHVHPGGDIRHWWWGWWN